MVLPAVKSQILSDLDQLSPERQKRAAELVHQLVPPPSKGVSGRDLLRFAGTLDAESAREMKEAIEEGCERVCALQHGLVLASRDGHFDDVDGLELETW